MVSLLQILIGSFVFGFSHCAFADIKNEDAVVLTKSEIGSSTWYDAADDMIENLSEASQSFYNDAEEYRLWVNNLNALSEELAAQSIARDNLFQQLYSEIESLKQQAMITEVSHNDEIVKAQQEQFDIDGKKVEALIEAFDRLRSDFNQTVGAQKEVLFSRLESFISQLRTHMEKIISQDNSISSILNNNEKAD